MRTCPRIVVAGAVALLATGLLRTQTLTWEPVPQLGIREGHCMAYDPIRDRVVLFGGTYCDGYYRNDTWEWDGQHWMERHPLTRPRARYFGRMAFDYVRSTTILFGGNTFDGTPGSGTLNDMWEWDGQDWQQIQVPVLPPWRSGHGMASDPVRGRITVFGGFGATVLAQGDLWEWDGVQWTQLSPSPMPSPRAFCNMAWCGSRGKIVLQGGGIGYSYATDTCWEWDGTTWISYNGPGPGMRRVGACCETPWNGKVLLHGGLHYNGVTEDYEIDTWEWGAQGWRNVNPPHRPSYRDPQEMSVHGGTQEVVLFGGRFTNNNGPWVVGTDPNDRQDATWLFQQYDWTRVMGINETQDWLASVITAAQDGPRDRTVAMMRYNTNYPYWETWIIEGDRYRLAAPSAASPPYRLDASICTHEALGVVVLFGGQLGLPRDDTWIWDGIAWHRDTSPNHPPAGYNGNMTYDPDREAVVLVQVNGNRVFEYGAQGWRERLAAQLPFGGRLYFTLCYDAGRHRLVYAGIANNTAGAMETWEFDGSSWQQSQPPNPPPQWIGGTGYYAKWLGGCVWSGRANYPSGLILYDGTDWRVLAPERELADGRRGFWYLPICADPGRQRLRAVIPALCTALPSASTIWDLYLRTLVVSTHHPRLGQRLTLDVHLPSYPSNVAALLFSHRTWPGIPIGSGPGDLVFPIADGGVLRASLGAPLLVFTDLQGRGSVTLSAIPNNPALVGLQLSAAGLTLDAALRRIGTTTNPITFDIIR